MQNYKESNEGDWDALHAMITRCPKPEIIAHCGIMGLLGHNPWLGFSEAYVKVLYEEAVKDLDAAKAFFALRQLLERNETNDFRVARFANCLFDAHGIYLMDDALAKAMILSRPVIYHDLLLPKHRISLILNFACIARYERGSTLFSLLLPLYPHLCSAL